MDHIAVKEYVLVYFHTLTSEYNHLDSDFLKKLYDVVDVKSVSQVLKVDTSFFLSQY